VNDVVFEHDEVQMLKMTSEGSCIEVYSSVELILRAKLDLMTHDTANSDHFCTSCYLVCLRTYKLVIYFYVYDAIFEHNKVQMYERY